LVELAGNGRIAIAGDEPQPTREAAPTGDELSENETDPSPLPIYVTPFFNSIGPAIEVGKFSRELKAADEKTILSVTDQMKKEWDTLTIEQMYVAAIRLFDLGQKDLAVYWFYSAQIRSRFYVAVAIQNDAEGKPTLAFEQAQTFNAFYQLSGPFINPYAFRFPGKLKITMKKVLEEHQKPPPLQKIYSEIEFQPEEKWNEELGIVRGGLSKLLKAVDLIKPSKGDEATREDLEDAFRHKTPLHKAFDAGDRNLYVKLLKEGADPNFRPFVESCLLHLTAKHRDPFWLRTALKYGGDPNLRNTGHPYAPGYTPLLTALAARQHTNVLLLIKAGADLNLDDDGTTPLFKAQQWRQWWSMMALLDAGADPRLTATRPSFDGGWDREHLEHYNDLDEFDYRVHESNRKEYGWDYTLDEEKEMYFKVRARLIKDGVLKPDKVEPSPAKDAP
ncbi:MAG: ankyrin repeat domain-containing protein, partial [Planctomycetota bacterium]|nr:ankyrin repeat domain-containing protein [Planctomycetota bacterium]